MTKIFYILPFLIVSATNILGQEFSKTYFTRTKWFTNNQDSAFFRSDTLKLVLYTNLAPKSQTGGEKAFQEDASSYFNSARYVELEFKKYETPYLYQIVFIEYELNSTWPASIWSFDKKQKTITIKSNKYLATKYKATFRPIFEKQVRLKSRYNDNSLTTTELILVRLK